MRPADAGEFERCCAHFHPRPSTMGPRTMDLQLDLTHPPSPTFTPPHFHCAPPALPHPHLGHTGHAAHSLSHPLFTSPKLRPQA